MRLNDQTRVMTLGKLPFTHSVNPLLGNISAIDDTTKTFDSNIRLGMLLAVIATGGILSGVHGYYRNRKKLGWAALWALLGLTMPVPTVAYAAGQGFAKRIR